LVPAGRDVELQVGATRISVGDRARGAAASEVVGTVDVPIQGLQTNDPSTLHYQFDLSVPSGDYPFIVDVPNVFSD
jgi:hypothetical protein